MALRDIIDRHKGCKSVFIIGGGPSIEMVDRSALNCRDHVIVNCNKAFQLYPDAAISHHSDYKWWQENQNDLHAVFKGGVVTGCGLGNSHRDYRGLVELLKFQGAGFPSGPETTTGLNTAQQAMVTAHFFEPKYIVLLGVDQSMHNGKCHWSGAGNWQDDDAAQLARILSKSNKWFDTFARDHAKLIADAGLSFGLPKIISVSPITAVRAFDQYDAMPDWVL